MKALAQSVHGEFLSSEEHGALIIDPACAQVYLRYALVDLSAGGLFFPELLLDDWGHEITTLDLYKWMRDNGSLFPRAELFGYDHDGKDRQYFLREIDLLSRYPCYGYSKADDPITDGLEINYVVLVVDEPVQNPWPPDTGEITWPMSNAAVSWWQVDSKNSGAFAKSMLSSSSRNEAHSVNEG